MKQCFFKKMIIIKITRSTYVLKKHSGEVMQSFVVACMCPKQRKGAMQEKSDNTSVNIFYS
uniref:Uncharacterized protein n=1 Tax=Anguilla anguilla TaxID=7936 RepID=A0A0E9PUA5_ANGAN